MLKKASRNSRAVVDVPADDPVGTMDRFTRGLRRIVSARKHVAADRKAKGTTRVSGRRET